MAKSSRRKKEDRARVETRHADEARQRDRAEAVRQAEGLFDRAIDLALPPSALTALIMDGLTDWTGSGFIAYARLQRGAPPATLAETSQLLLAACSGDGPADSRWPTILPPGVLAFAAVAAHANGQEEEEHSYVETLQEPARTAGAERPLHPLLQGAWDVLTWTHPAEAAEMSRRYLLDHPKAYAVATATAKLAAKPGPFADPDAAAFTQLGDPSSPRFARRLTDRVSQQSADDPSILARYRAEAKAEFLARRGVPPWAMYAKIRAESEHYLIPLD